MQTGNLQLDRQLSRWYELKDHPVQLALVDAVKDGVRFPLVPAGRRSGKTERFKRFLVKQANKIVGPYFAAAPTHDQAKKIFWDDLLKFSLSFTHTKRPNIAERIIYLNNGSEIHVLGLDKPQRIEGIPWKGGGIDEFADIKPDAWESNIYPALNTVNPIDPDYRAWCWLLGVPDGLNHYYDLCQNAETDADANFKVFHWMTAEIFPEMAEDAKKVMSLKQYKQEFEASFETASGRIYEDYSKANHTTETIQEHEQLLWYHDFNYTPLSSGVGVKRGDDYYLLEEIVLISAVALNSAQEFVERYKDHKNKKVIIYGDPAGKAGEKHSQASDYTDIEAELRSHGWTYERRVRSKAMSIKDSQNALRAKIKSADNIISLYVNTINAPYTHKGLSTVQLKKGSTFMEVESDYQHITTAVRYMMDYEHPVNKPVAYMPIRFSI
jgi:lambda repressor-like predicted transcriptional regulator